MDLRKMGVEEELLLVDPVTGQLMPVADRALRHSDDDAPLEQELFLHQLETATKPQADVEDLHTDLVAAREGALTAAESAGAGLVAVGLPILADWAQSVTPKARYLKMMREYGFIGEGALTCGMHVHVDVADDEEGVAVIDRMRPWLPCLAALTSNSPYFDGADSGYASWRTPVWERWPSAGAMQEFGSVATYRQVIDELIASGAALDTGMIYFDARLADSYPTVEIRVGDVCTRLADVELFALLARALVETEARAWHAGDAAHDWRVEVLRGARWRAARYGTTDLLLDPTTRTVVPAADALQSLLAHVRDALDDAGDTSRASDGVARVLRDGTGAERQRREYERSGDLLTVVQALRVSTGTGS